MNPEIQTLIISIVSGGLIGGVITTIRFWNSDGKIKKSDTKIKESEAGKAASEEKQTEIETQNQKIDLGDKYLAQVKALADMMLENTELTKNGNVKLNDLYENIKTIHNTIDKHNSNFIQIISKLETHDFYILKIMECMNGKWGDFCKEQGIDPKPNVQGIKE